MTDLGLICFILLSFFCRKCTGTCKVRHKNVYDAAKVRHKNVYKTCISPLFFVTLLPVLIGDDMKRYIFERLAAWKETPSSRRKPLIAGVYKHESINTKHN